MDLQTVLALLRQTLETQRGPILGAVLKQRINAALVAQGRSGLDERKLGFKKFSDLLLSQHSWLDVVLPTGPGDVKVSLKESPQLAPADLGGQPLAIRSDIWQAFTNPDLQRERFFKRQSKSIFHFKRSEEANSPAVDGNPDLIPIQPIPGSTHLGWMRKYLESSKLPLAERASVEAMLSEEYTSSLNLTFTRALGSNALKWRQYRTSCITEFIMDWALSNGLTETDLEKPPKTEALAAALPAASHLSPRAKIEKLLDLLSDDDLNQVVLPILLSTILVKAKM